MNSMPVVDRNKSRDAREKRRMETLENMMTERGFFVDVCRCEVFHRIKEKSCVFFHNHHHHHQMTKNTRKIDNCRELTSLLLG